MAAQSSDEEGNQWPGYVDALTTMTMMLIFIMIILAVAIFGMSQNVARDYVQRIADAAHVKFSGSKGDMEQLVQEVRAKVNHEQQLASLGSDSLGSDSLGADVRIERRNTQPTPITMEKEPVKGESLLVKSVAPAAAVPSSQEVAVNPGDAMIRLVFQPRAVEVDKAAEGEIGRFMDKDARLKTGATLEIKAYAAAEAGATDARRIAFYRLMNVRAKLMALGISPTRIVSKVHDRLPGVTTEDVHVFVRAPA
jgi:Na+-transporting methylmalonyl-CoA/oxaloacetate decarboxylase gamma subunit